MSEPVTLFDNLLDQFEALWKAGPPPALADFLPTDSGPQARTLARELIKLDLYYRVQAGEPPPVAGRYAQLPNCPLRSALAQELAALEAQWRTPQVDTAVQDPEGTNPSLGDATRSPLPPPSQLSDPDRLPAQIGRYPIQGLIGRGGMGVVYRGLDPGLLRVLAIKVLLPEHRADAELQQRFLKEAQIMGQLQHPGVAPIHEVGALSDGRPFFSMKQIEGHTFAALLAKRSGAADELPMHVGIFGHICQTLAYAHARRIIHRDLKPENVMVGAFGEVQVMDWGLAKILGEADREDSSFRTPANPEGTVPGTVMGTLAYMAPEQARGETDKVDTRSDVFGLGAILCEILTGRPPYTAAKSYERHLQAAAADLREVLAKLQGCGADAELVALAHRCLAAEREQRPKDAGEVAAAAAHYQAQVQARLQVAQVAEAAAQVKAAEERKRRMVSIAFLAAVLALVVAVAGGAVWYIQDQADQAERAARAREEKNALEAQQAAEKRLQKTEQVVRGEYVSNGAAAALTDSRRWLDEIAQRLADPLTTAELLSNPPQEWEARLTRAQTAWDHAAALLGSTKHNINPAVVTRLAELDRNLQAAHADWALARELDTIRLRAGELKSGKFDTGLAAQQYRAFFADKLQMDFAADTPESLAARIVASRLRYVLVAALDHWAEVISTDAADFPRVLETARRADPDPWRDEVRHPQSWHNPIILEKLASQAATGRHSPFVLLLLVKGLHNEQRTKVLKQASLHFPHDFWVHFHLASVVKDRGQAAGHYQTALAIRAAVPVCYFNIGNCLADAKDLDGAIEAYCKAIASDAHYAHAYNNLGILLNAKGDPAGAISAYRKAIKSNPKYATAYYNLGNVLAAQKELDGAIDAYRKAAAAEPQYDAAHYNLGNALRNKGDLEGAIASYRQAIACNPTNAFAHNNLGSALEAKGDWKGAIAAYRQAVESNPKYARAFNNLGNALRTTGELGAAMDAYRQAIAADPNFPFPYGNLGVALRQQGSLQESVQALQKAVKLMPQNEIFQDDLRISQRWLALDQRLPGVAAGKDVPAGAAETIEFADFCNQPFKKEYALALKLFMAAFAADPALEASRRYDAVCAAVLLAAGQDVTVVPLKKWATALRRQAHKWLLAELDFIRKDAQSDQPASRKKALDRLTHCTRDADLASIRDSAALKSLPAEERESWQHFWNEVDDLVAALAKPADN
jgi:tetratricopeptide (TPR) repeat protein